MTVCPSCNDELDNEYLNSVMDELYRHKDSPFFFLFRQCPHCKYDLLFKKIVLSYYLVTNNKEILIGGA